LTYAENAALLCASWHKRRQFMRLIAHSGST
jgi:hypothetical protein